MIDKEEIMWSVLGKQPKNKEIEPSEVLLCMDEYAKEVAIDFFKWYGLRVVAFIEYITKIRPLVESNEMEEKIKEHEGATFQELFNQYLNSKS